MKISPITNSGFSLIEILVSLVVLSIGLMGLAGLQLASLKGSNDAHYRTQASLLIMDLADRMRANQQGVALGEYRTNFQGALNCNTAPTPNCATDDCSEKQLADFDKVRIACGVKRLLPSGILSVNCKNNDCKASDLGLDTQLNKTHTLKISWREQKNNRQDLSLGESETRFIELDMVP